MATDVKTFAFRVFVPFSVLENACEKVWGGMAGAFESYTDFMNAFEMGAQGAKGDEDWVCYF